MATLTANLSQLNAQRRRAVQLRVDGLSLARVREETGLSVPTIIGAFKAFTEGGWHAVDVGARGRPQGTGRALTQAQEAQLALLALYGPPEVAQKLPPAIGEANNFRVIFFLLTFFSIGLLSNFKKLWQEGFAKLVAVYLVSLFGFVIWVGLVISWIFFHGVLPPTVS